MTGTGAFLLLAAAAFFIAVNWTQLGPTIRLLILAVLTGLALIAGRRMRRSLPATAGVVYHLGAFMLPILAAALLVDLEQPAEMFFLVQGAVAAVGFTLLNRTEQSVILRWGAAGGVVLFAAGLGSVLHVSPAFVLVVFALIASILHHRRPAAAWALIAGLAPTVALVEHFVPLHADMVDRLHLIGADTRLFSIATGLIAAFVLGREAHEARDLLFAAFAGVVGILGITTGWVELRPTPGLTWVAAAALFVVAEIIVHLVRHDPFWARPARMTTSGIEVIAGAIVAGAACVAVPLTVIGHRSFDPAPLVAGVLAACAFYLADLRRRDADNLPTAIALLVGSGWLPGSLGMAAALFAGAVFGSASLAVSGGVLLALAVFFVVSGRPGGHALAVGLTTAAPALAYDSVLAAALYAIGGALTIAAATILRARMNTGRTAIEQAGLLAFASLFPVAVGMFVAYLDLWFNARIPAAFAILGVGAAVAWALGIVIDRARPGDDASNWLGWIPRAGAVFVIAFAPALPAPQVALLAGGLTLVAILDGIRRSDPAIGGIATITMPVATIATVLALGGSWAIVGIAFCGVAVVFGAVSMVVPRTWKAPALALMFSHAGVGLWLTLHEPHALGIGLILLGGLAAAFAIRHQQPDASLLGFLAVIVGIWVELAAGNVSAIDAYVAPIAALLVIAGFNARRQNDSIGSWVAYAPAIALLGGVALAEYIADGRSWVHGVVVLAVGVAAVLAGGTRRLSAPLLLGTALLIALTAYECIVSGGAGHAPSWVWPAIGGAILVAAGIAMERHDTGPIETGRRLVDVVQERFS